VFPVLALDLVWHFGLRLRRIAAQEAHISALYFPVTVEVVSLSLAFAKTGPNNL
jgi:hypothetical protein